MFTIAQLEPCPDPALDLFSRVDRPKQPDSIFIEGDTDITKSYEVEKIVSHRNTRRRGIEYLVRWKGQGPEHDEWRNLAELGNALEALQDYRNQHEVKDSPLPARATDHQPSSHRPAPTTEEPHRYRHPLPKIKTLYQLALPRHKTQRTDRMPYLTSTPHHA